MSLTLVVLAAGMSTRYGGPKQLEPFGPDGEALLDYALHDARANGFERAVLIVQRAMRDAFEQTVVARWRGSLEVELAFQERDGREKPWGTGHAVLAAAGAVRTPFAVLNADDFYGRGTYDAAARFLTEPPRADVPVYAVVGFPLRETLVESGGVNRALLRVSADGWLERIEETMDITRRAGAAIGRDESGALIELPLDAPVSMNFWAFAPEVFTQLEAAFDAFRREHGDDPRREFLLPGWALRAMSDGEARFRVLEGSGPWCGVTHPSDAARVSDMLRVLADRGVYPRPAWR